MELRDYLCSTSPTGPWTAVFASSYDGAALQFRNSEFLSDDERIYVGIPAPIPDLFSAEQLARFIADRLGIHVSSKLADMAKGLAGECNYRLSKYATDEAEDMGRAIRVRVISSCMGKTRVESPSRLSVVAQGA
jgi:hypothetical protein